MHIFEMLRKCSSLTFR